MVLEIALIDVTAGEEPAFVSAYGRARELVATTPGCRSMRLVRGIESPTRFVLLVEWDSVAAHLENFRASERFPQWRALIGPYFAQPPVVEHFAGVDPTGFDPAGFDQRTPAASI